MNIRIGKGTLAILLAILVGAAAYWYWSPHLAMRHMLEAAKAGDADAFNDHVDYPKLRESVKGQMAAMVTSSMKTSTDAKNPFEALGAMLGLALVDKMVEAMIRPEFVMQGMKSGKFTPEADELKGEAASSPEGQAAANQKSRWDYERKGVDKIIVRMKDDTLPKEDLAGVVFERSGFATWKMTEIRLPLPKKR